MRKLTIHSELSNLNTWHKFVKTTTCKATDALVGVYGNETVCMHTFDNGNKTGVRIILPNVQSICIIKNGSGFNRETVCLSVICNLLELDNPDLEFSNKQDRVAVLKDILKYIAEDENVSIYTAL